MKYAADGSVLCRFSASPPSHGLIGLFDADGCMRINAGLGTPPYSPNGALRVTVSNNEATPAPGTGLYTPDGKIRCTQTPSALYNHPGIYAKDGSLRITILP